MTFSLNLATRIALDTCAAWASALDGKVLIATTGLPLGKSLLERLQITPGIQCILLSDGDISPPVAFEIDSGSSLTLVLFQPLKAELDFSFSLLRNRKLNQLILLQSSWLGRKILPEWNTPSEHSSEVNSKLSQFIQTDRNWSFREIAVGNLKSLLWGFVSGRLLSLNRADLADHSNARVRRHLVPREAGLGPSYLTIIRAIKDNNLLVDTGNFQIAR